MNNVDDDDNNNHDDDDDGGLYVLVCMYHLLWHDGGLLF